MIIRSDDGSDTLLSDKFGVTYHSKNGALEESNIIFIEAGLNFVAGNTTEIQLFEMGFGTGLNAFLTYLYAVKNRVKIDYSTVEAFPVDRSIYSKLNYCDLLAVSQEEREVFIKMHEVEWGKTTLFGEYFTFIKYLDQIENVINNTTFNMSDRFDLIYFDAFDPSTQPELWSNSFFEDVYGIMKTKGVLTTYCAQGQFKRNLKAIGFEVQPLPGPTGKREITRAIKS